MLRFAATIFIFLVVGPLNAEIKPLQQSTPAPQVPTGSAPNAPAMTPPPATPVTPPAVAPSAPAVGTPAALPATTPMPPAEKTEKWQAEIPPEMKDVGLWAQLMDEFIHHNAPFSAMAAASRGLIFFNDLPTKERAYKTIIQVVDQGYPYSTLGYFVSGDIEPRDAYEFSNSYNLYKAILNREKGMERWAETYFANVDKDNFSKYLFYVALDQYAKGDLTHAEESLRKILAREWAHDQVPFLRKVVRTLARIYFDREEYEKSLDIYKSFLLKLNPVMPSDWLEGAWNQYYLKHYPEALGYTFNLESHLGDSSLDLEKFSLRALIYKSLCRAANFEALGESFRKQFGDVVDGLKKGESFSHYPQLKIFKVPGNAEFQQVYSTLQELKAEQNRWRSKKIELERLRLFFYESEIGMLEQRLKALEYPALERSASRVLLMAEQLRFMKFEVARQKFNPESVFLPSTAGDPRLSEKGDRYQIRWAQFGDFWRDERLNYKGVIDHQCTE
jgi:tetratricopeptide (TPR) repeat protein